MTDAREPTDLPRSSGPRGLELYDAADGIGLLDSGTMSFPEFPDDATQAIADEELDLSPLAVGFQETVLFRGDEPEGFSLVRARFGPHYVLPRHSHNADCLYYLESGSIQMGNHEIRPGSGFFVPADAPYAYEAGPDGAVVLEFRNRPTFDMKINAGQVERFRRMAETGAANVDRWRELQEEQEAERGPA